MHEDLGKAVVFDFLEGLDGRREIQVTTPRHLQKLLLLWQFLVTSHPVLPSVKDRDAITQVFDQVCESLGVYLRHGFAVLERELAGENLATAATPSADARTLGVIDPARAREVFYGTIESAVVPALENHCIEAGRAWRDRAVAT